MKIITELPEHMNDQLNQLARDRGMTKSSLIRWSLGHLLQEELDKNDWKRND